MKKEKLAHIIKHQNNPEEMQKLSRRDLLTAGVLPFAARIFMPSSLGMLATLLSKEVEASEAPFSWMPMITLNLEGGAALHGNILALNKSGDFLPEYTYHGLGTLPQPEMYMGVKFDARSKMLAGLKSIVSTNAAALTRIVPFCTNTAIDTRGVEPLRPQFDLAPQIEKAGRIGSFYSSIEFNGANTSLRSFHANEPKSRLSVSSLSQVTDALSLTSVFMDTVSNKTRFSTKQKTKMIQALSKLTEIQLSKNQSSERFHASGKNIVAASKDLIDVVGGTLPGSTIVNPLNSPETCAVYKLTTSSNETEKTKAAVTYTNLMGYASSGFIHLGGYDYHEPFSRTNANNMDFNAGVEIGRMIELAHRLKKSIFIFVATDGACFSADSSTNTSIWSSDTTSSLQLAIAYDPSGVKGVGSNLQVGYYNDDQTVQKDTLVGDRSDYVASAVMANYLYLQGKLNEHAKIMPATITSDRLSEVVKINI